MPPVSTETLDVLITALSSKFDEHARRQEKSVDEIKIIIDRHVESDKIQFGKFSDELTRLNINLTTLNTTVKGLEGSFIPWPWFIGIMVTLLIIVGGSIGGVYIKLGDLSERISNIEYVANSSTP